MNRLHDITEAYIAHLGLKRIKGSGADPILPFFMLDVMNTIYRKDILPLISSPLSRMSSRTGS